MTTRSIAIQSALVLGVSALNYLATRFVHPYEHDVLNEMEKRALWSSTVTLYCSMYFLSSK